MCGQRHLHGAVGSSVWGWLSPPETLGRAGVGVCVASPPRAAPTGHLWAAHLFQGPRRAVHSALGSLLSSPAMETSPSPLLGVGQERHHGWATEQSRGRAWGKQVRLPVASDPDGKYLLWVSGKFRFPPLGFPWRGSRLCTWSFWSESSAEREKAWLLSLARPVFSRLFSLALLFEAEGPIGFSRGCQTSSRGERAPQREIWARPGACPGLALHGALGVDRPRPTSPLNNWIEARTARSREAVVGHFVRCCSQWTLNLGKPVVAAGLDGAICPSVESPTPSASGPLCPHLPSSIPSCGCGIPP